MDVEPDGELPEARVDALSRRVAGGFAWASAAYVGGRALTLVATAVLAHLLSPRDFGVVALALVFTAVLDNFADLGVSQALVVLDESEAQRRASSAWTISVLTGLGMAAVTALCAPLVAEFFHEPQVRPLLSVLGLTFAIRAVASTHYALAQRALDFRSRSAAETAEVLVRGAVGCSLAVGGAGAWSLVIGYVAGSATAVLVLWTLVPFRPRPRLRREELSGLLRFGSGLTAVDLLWAVVVNVDYLLIGRVLGAVPLGLYSLGFRLPELLVQNLAVVAGRVLYPTFAGLDRAVQGRAFLVSLRYTALVAVGVATGLAVLARPAVEALFGDAWLPAVPVMQVLCLHAVAVALAIPPGSVYKATGRARIILRFSVPRTVLVVAGVAIFVSHGIVAVAWVQAVVNGLVDLVGIVVACRVLHVPLMAAGRALWPSVIPASGMAVVLIGVERAIGAPWLALIVGTVLGAAVWAALLAAVAPDVLRQLRALRRRGAVGVVA